MRADLGSWGTCERKFTSPPTSRRHHHMIITPFEIEPVSKQSPLAFCACRPAEAGQASGSFFIPPAAVILPYTDLSSKMFPAQTAVPDGREPG